MKAENCQDLQYKNITIDIKMEHVHDLQQSTPDDGVFVTVWHI